MARFVGFQPRGNLKGLTEITPRTISGVEAYVRWCEIEVPQRVPYAMDQLVHYMALINQSDARKMAYGPYDPSGKDTSLAWRTPSQGIRRISQAYYLGWRIKKRNFAHYIVYNDTREAYFIEYGISEVGFGGSGNRSVPSRRIRRPVRKLSVLKTMQFMATTQAYHRIWVDIFRSRHTHAGFTQIIQSPAGGHNVWENVSEHEAVGEVVRNARKGMFSPHVRARNGRFQIRKPNRGGGSYTGPMLGRHLP
jgi:hypothetical protein